MAAPDLFPLTQETWSRRAPEVVEAVFGPGGVLSRHVPGFVHEPAQRDFALTLALSATRGSVPGASGRVTMVEAGTGVGKTLAYLVVGLVAAMLSGKRFMVSTFTRQLLVQAVGKEAAVAVKVVAEILGSADGETYRGRRIRVAPRRARSAFVSPSRARAYAAEVRAAGGDEAARVLEDYAGMAQEAIDRVAAGETPGVLAELAGLTETFDAEHPWRAAILADLPPDRWNLVPTCPEPEQSVWRAYLDNANEAAAVVVTHAALVIDMSLHGRLSKGREKGFALVVVDEAHALDRAAQSAFGTKRSIAEMARDGARLRLAIQARDDIGPLAKSGLDGKARAYGDAAQAVCDKLRDDVRRRGDLKSFDIAGDEPWLAEMSVLQRAIGNLHEALVGANLMFTVEAAERLRTYDAEIDTVLDVVAYRRKTGKTGMFRPVVSLTPVREDPCLQVVPLHGQRVVSRMWGRGREGVREPMADAVVFTSATLGLPGREGWDAYASMAWTLGVGKDAVEVETDLCRRIEPTLFGRPSFVWADPKAPRMTAEGKMTDAGAAYAAHGVATAAGTRHPARGTSRQLVLTTSFADADRIASALPEELRHRTVVRTRDVSLAKAVTKWLLLHDGILVTPGAFEGLDLPGLVDHLHLPRLPFPPRPEAGNGQDDFAWMRRDMMQTFRQGVGRAIRGKNDDPTIWVTDTRVPPPDAVLARHRKFPQARAQASYLGAFPARFRRAMDKGALLECPAGLGGGTDAVPTEAEAVD